MKKKRINKKKFRLVIDALTEIGKTRKRTWKVTNPEPYTYIFEKYDKRLCREVSNCFDCGRLYDGAKKIIEGNDDIFIGFIHSVIYDIYPELWGVLFNLRKRDVYLCFSQVRKGLTNSYKF